MNHIAYYCSGSVFDKACYKSVSVNRKAVRSIFLLILIISTISGCSSFGPNTKESLTANINTLKFNVAASEQRVIIYNHGINRPQEREPCYMPYNQAPPSLVRLSLQSPQRNLIVYRLCSTATESPIPSSAGKQVYLRKREINHAIDAFLARGIRPKHLFLAGHSNGAWTALMMMRDVNKRFNGVIAFAPAFAGKRDEVSIAPWWRNRVRPMQIKDMLGAPEMDALVFAYHNDAYNRPQDLMFLTDNYPLMGNRGVKLISYGCSGFYPPHVTFWKDCRLKKTMKYIQQFIDQQVSSYWSL